MNEIEKNDNNEVFEKSKIIQHIRALQAEDKELDRQIQAEKEKDTKDKV